MQNPRVVKSKGRLKGALENMKLKIDWLTKRDASQHELMEAALLRDTSKLKRIYKIPKKPGRPKDLKTVPKIKVKPISPLKKQKRKQMEAEIYKKSILRITNRRRNKIMVKSDSDEDEESMVIESSDDEIEAEDKIEGKAEDEAKNKIENETEDKTEDKTEEHDMRISALRRPQRNIQLPMRYRG